MESRKRTTAHKGKEETDSLTRDKSLKILIVDDEPDILVSYQEALENVNHLVTTSLNGKKCLEIYRQEFKESQSKTDDPSEACPFDVVVLDYKMPKMNGLDTAEEILLLNPRQRIIFASAYVYGTVEDSMRQLGRIVEVLKKPFALSELVDLIENKKIYAELEKLNVNVHNLKGINPSHESVKIYLEALEMLQKSRTN